MDTMGDCDQKLWCSLMPVPCQPESLEHSEISDGNCQMTWEAVDYAAGYIANVLRSDSTLQECDTASPICSFTCECGYMYLMSVYAYNDAGESTPVKKNFTTCKFQQRWQVVKIMRPFKEMLFSALQRCRLTCIFVYVFVSPVICSVLLSKRCRNLHDKHRDSAGHLDIYARGRAVPDQGYTRFRCYCM